MFCFFLHNIYCIILDLDSDEVIPETPETDFKVESEPNLIPAKRGKFVPIVVPHRAEDELLTPSQDLFSEHLESDDFEASYKSVVETSMTPTMLANVFGPSLKFESGNIDIQAIISALISATQSQAQLNLKFNTDDVDLKAASVDELIDIHNKCHENVTRSLIETRTSS